MRIRVPIAAFLLPGLLLLSACGTISTSGGPAAVGTPAGQEASKSPNEIVNDAEAVLQAVDSYTISFSGTDDLGPLSFTLNVDTRSNATGTMTQNGQTSQVVYFGSNIYVQQRGLAQVLWQPVLDPSFDGKWIVMPTAVLPFIDTFRTPTLVGQCAADFASNALLAGQTKINGVDAIPLIANDSEGNKDVISVALDGTAHFLTWQVKASPSTPPECLGGSTSITNQLSWAPASLPIGTFTFSGYQAPVNVVVPNTTANAPAPTETPSSP